MSIYKLSLIAVTNYNSLEAIFARALISLGKMADFSSTTTCIAKWSTIVGFLAFLFYRQVQGLPSTEKFRHTFKGCFNFLNLSTKSRLKSSLFSYKICQSWVNCQILFTGFCDYSWIDWKHHQNEMRRIIHWRSSKCVCLWLAKKQT